MFCQDLRSAEVGENGFGMIFVTETIRANFICAGRQAGVIWRNKRADNHSGMSSVADGYPNTDLRISCR